MGEKEIKGTFYVIIPLAFNDFRHGEIKPM